MVEIIGQILPRDEALIRELARTDAGMARLLDEFNITVIPESETGAEEDGSSWVDRVVVETYPDGSTWTIHHSGTYDKPRHVIASASEAVSVS